MPRRRLAPVHPKARRRAMHSIDLNAPAPFSARTAQAFPQLMRALRCTSYTSCSRCGEPPGSARRGFPGFVPVTASPLSISGGARPGAFRHSVFKVRCVRRLRRPFSWLELYSAVKSSRNFYDLVQEGLPKPRAWRGTGLAPCPHGSYAARRALRRASTPRSACSARS